MTSELGRVYRVRELMGRKEKQTGGTGVQNAGLLNIKADNNEKGFEDHTSPGLVLKRVKASFDVRESGLRLFKHLVTNN